MDSEVLIEYLLSICISSCLKALRHLAPSHFGFQDKWSLGQNRQEGVMAGASPRRLG